MRYLVVLLVLATQAGCVHGQLRYSALRSASIIPDLQQQQVMDNIARFCHNPDALPYFAVAGVGTVQVGQAGGASLTLLWNPRTILTEALNLNGSRSVVEQYSVAVTVSPDQLSVMRSAYQWLLGIHTDENRNRLADFYGENFEEVIPTEPWFSCGSDCPPKCACCVGHHCGTYAWVMPEHQDQLTRFTLAILDAATAGPLPPRPMRDVKVTYDGPAEEGKLSKTEITVKEPIQRPSPAAPGETPRSVEIPGLPGTTGGYRPAPGEREPRPRQNFFNPGAGIQFSPLTQ
jgi:hypothetical protein